MFMLAILDFGGQYVENIRRCFLEMGVDAKIVPWNTKASEIKWATGVVLSGGPYSVYQKNAPLPDKNIFSLGIPILGLCYGHQSMAHILGGKVEKGAIGEYGFAELLMENDKIFSGLKKREICWMSHGDVVSVLPKGFKPIASSAESKIAAFRNGKMYGLQFHPEVGHTPKGSKILGNFAKLCGMKKSAWSARQFLKSSKKDSKIGDSIIAVSGGVDSTVAAVLAKRLLKKVHLIHVDTGLMRKNESETVVSLLKNAGVEAELVDAKEIFIEGLKGVTNPDKKRKIIGKLFIDVFERFSMEKGAKCLIQGTIAPDVIESTRGDAKLKGGAHGGAIKLHHNVGGLPERMNLKVYEPLRNLFKHQVRALGRELEIPKGLIERQPFPGPGLATRITGEVTREKLNLLREATHIAEKHLSKSNPSQYFAALVNSRGKQTGGIWMLNDTFVGVKGDERLLGKGAVIKSRESWVKLMRLQASITGEQKDVCRVFLLVGGKPGVGFGIILRAVDTQDFMTASPTQISRERLKKCAKQIMHLGVSFVAYEITTKPPATIEII